MTVALLVVALLAIGAASVTLLRRQRRLAKRVARVSARLGHRVERPDSLSEAVEGLEVAVATSGERDEKATAADRMFLALDALPQGIVICNERGEVVFENEGGAVLSRPRHADALVAAALGEVLQQGIHGVTQERTLELFGPPRRSVVITAYPLLADGTSKGAFAVVEDVTERRRLESIRRDFVANISHELKTPVGALALLAETLVGEPDAETRQRLTSRMLDESHRVARTIEDLLVLSRIEAERETAHPTLRVHDVIDEAVARARPGAEQRHVTISVSECPADLAVKGDTRQLVSALYNLLDNAVKYSDSGSRVTITAVEADGWAELVVSDAGAGIPSRDLDRIFERFYRVDPARSRDTGGTGLGLAIVRHVAENHGGEVTVQSREGEGSAFTLRLPALRVPVAEQAAL